MSDNNDHKEQRLGLWIAGAAAGLATLGVLFFSIWGWETGKIEGSPAYEQSASMVVTEAAASEVTEGEADSMSALAHEGMASDVVATETVAPADVAIVENQGQLSDEAAIIVENGIVKFYFASGKADLAVGAQDALQEVLAGVKNGKKAIVSGFHDSTGNVAQNEKLSKQRAMVVKEALLGLGVAEGSIELRKPTNSEGGGDKAEARRVEVVLE